MSDLLATCTPISPSLLALFHLFIIDVSRSMMEKDLLPSRLKAALDASMAYISRLSSHTPSSSIAAIGYSDDAFMLCGWTPVGSLGPLGALAKAWHETCTKSGLRNTNIAGALLRALPLVAKRGRPTQIVLLSDGHHNAEQDPRPFAECLKQLATVHTVGIGGAPNEVDEQLLRAIASPDGDGQPQYRWIGNRGALIRHYEELSGGICHS